VHAAATPMKRRPVPRVVPQIRSPNCDPLFRRFPLSTLELSIRTSRRLRHEVPADPTWGSAGTLVFTTRAETAPAPRERG
jgi:hypothetical protein